MKSRPQSVERVFLYSVAVMISFAAMILANSEGTPLPSLLTPIVALFSVEVIDRRRKFGLSIMWANILGVAAFLVAATEFSGGTPLTKLIAGSHLLVYITWVVLLLRKGIRQFWWLCSLATLQVAVASVLTTDASFGLWLVAMLLIMVWTMSVFSLYRTRRRLSREMDGVEDSLDTESTSPADRRKSFVMVKNGLQLDASQAWLGWRFKGIVSVTFLCSLLVAAITFLVFPRIWVPGSGLSQINEEQTQGLMNQTGFTDEVQLGDIGQIMQSTKRVLQFTVKDLKNGSTVTPEQFTQRMGMDELLFRGASLGMYSEGRWTNKRSNTTLQERRVLYDRDAKFSDFEVAITQDPPIAKYAFVPLPISRLNYNTRGVQGYQTRNSFSILHWFRESEFRDPGLNPDRNQSLTYVAWCQKPKSGQKRHMPLKRSKVQQIPRNQIEALFLSATRTNNNNYEEEHRRHAQYWALTPNLNRDLPQLAQMAKDLCSDTDGQLLEPRSRVQKVFAFLNTSGQYTYTLNVGVQDKSIDPVEDFLLNTQKGHCEYFASACALMLQSVNIPARVVNGYKGYETNEISGVHEVAQRHAHAWVEVFVDDGWETIDPTPASARLADIDAGQSSLLADLARAMKDNWEAVITRMDLQRQEAMVKPIVDRVKAVVKIVKDRGVLEALKMFYREVILQPQKWVSWQTGVVTFVLLWIVAFLFRAKPLRWLLNKFRSGLGLLDAEARQQRSIVRFYENFRNVCERNGLSLSESHTAVEHANMAVQHFADRLHKTSDRELPFKIAKAFNQVRFGAQELGDDLVRSVREDVSRFSDLLSA